MAGLVILTYVLVVVIAVMVVWQVTQKRQRAELPVRLVPAVSAARRRALIAVAFAVVVFVAAGLVGTSIPSLLGIPIAIAPFVAASAGLLLYAATPPRAVELAAGQLRSAGLERRSWRTAIPARWLRGFVETALLFIALVIFCGMTAADDDLGYARQIRFTAPESSSAAGPYPGWFYGIPALCALAVLIVATVIALQRIGATAAFPLPEDAEADTQWRRASASVILGLSTGAILFALGGFALVAGQSMGNAIIANATAAVWSVIASVLFVMSLVFLVLSVISITLAALTAFTIGDRLAVVRAVVR